MCNEGKEAVKVALRHVWANYMEEVEELQYRLGMKEKFGKRKILLRR